MLGRGAVAGRGVGDATQTPDQRSKPLGPDAPAAFTGAESRLRARRLMQKPEYHPPEPETRHEAHGNPAAMDRHVLKQEEA